MSQFEAYLQEQRLREFTTGPDRHEPEQEHDSDHGHHHGHGQADEEVNGIVYAHGRQYPKPHIAEKALSIFVKSVFALAVFTAIAFFAAFLDVFEPIGSSPTKIIFCVIVMGSLAFFALIGIWFVRVWWKRCVVAFFFGMGMYLLFWFLLWNTLVH